MTDTIDNVEIFKRSVTANDYGEYQGRGVINFVVPYYITNVQNYPLPAELPPYWVFSMGLQNYFSRDTILRSTLLNESHWATAVARAASKQATKVWKLDGTRVNRWQRLILDLSGDGYIASLKRSMIDYTCTNNGIFFEIVRASSAAGSRILGLVHLDSLRCVRTNDPETPLIFWDLRGAYHALKRHQVLMMVDNPDPSTASLGMGHCAANDVYGQIYKMAVIERYYLEKISGTGATSLDFVSGLTTEQVTGIVGTAKQEAQAKGQVYFQGHVISGILSQAPLSHINIPLRDLPDGFDREKELLIAQLTYAVRIGLDPQDLNPRLVVSGTMGTAQAQVLHEKQTGSTLASFDAEFAQLVNGLILPSTVTFYFEENDLRQAQQEAANSLTRAQARGQQVTNGEISGPQALQMAVDANDAPREFIATDITAGEDLSSEEKPVTDEQLTQAQTDQAMQELNAEPKEPPVPEQPSIKELDALLALRDEIRAAREALTNA